MSASEFQKQVEAFARACGLSETQIAKAKKKARRNVTAGWEDPNENARFRLYRLCECTACEGRGKVRTADCDCERLGLSPNDDCVHDDPCRSDGRGRPVRCPDCRGEGRTRELVATATDAESVGVALVTLAREGEFAECGGIGLLDTQGETGKKWLIQGLWLPSARNLSDAGRTLRQGRKP